MIQISYHLNKLTGEVLGSREKRKFDKEIIFDKSLFQTMQGHKPVIFIKIDDNGDFEGVVHEHKDVTPTLLKKLSEEGFGLNENYKPNHEVARKNKVCLHCLKKLNLKDAISRINLDELKDYFELQRKEFRYFSTVKCDGCKRKTSFSQYIPNFTNTSEIPNLEEVIIDHIEYTDEKDRLFQEQKITEIVFGRVYSIKDIEDINELKNHDVIKTLLKYKDFKELDYIKFKRVNNYFSSNDFVKKYKVKAMV